MFILTPKKKCTKCLKYKPLEEFRQDTRRADGRGSWCKECKCVKERERRLVNPEKVRASERIWKDANPDKMRGYTRKYMKKWRQNNPDKVKVHSSNHRALKQGNGGTYTAQEWQTLKRLHHFTCLCCKKQEPEIKLSPDHIKPLSKGGSNSIANIQPLCIYCNIRKGIKEIDYR